MKTVEFRVYGDPKGQPRARAYRRGNRAGVYDPGTADAWKFAVREAARTALNGHSFGGAPIRLVIDFLFRRPKSHYRWHGKMCGDLKESAPRRHTQKPDRDNCEKAVMDALTSLGAWADDCQVCCGAVTKWWGPATQPHHNQSPGAYIQISEVEP